MARELIGDEALSADDRCEALAILLRRLPNLDEASDPLRMLAAKIGKARTLDLLAELERRFGPHPAVAEMRASLEDRVRTTCPRCGVELRQPQMQVHLWEVHRLLLDGLRVRDPWSVVEEWLDAAKANGGEGLARARIAADKIDLQEGKNRLARLMLMRGLADEQQRRDCLAEAAKRHAGCCPFCFAFMPVPSEEGPLRLRRRGMRLEAGGYLVAIDETGLRPRLTVRTPTELVYDGPEPDGRPLTADAAAGLASGFFVGLALMLSTLPHTLLPVVLLLLAAIVAYLVIRLAMRPGAVTGERLLEHAWDVLVPRLHADGFAAGDSAFVAGLSRLGGGEAAALGELARKTAAAVERGAAPPSHFAALLRRQIERAVEDADADAPTLVARQIGRCFTGKRPLALRNTCSTIGRHRSGRRRNGRGCACCCSTPPSRPASR